MLNLQYWQHWCDQRGCDRPVTFKGLVGSLKILEKKVGKLRAATLVQLGFFFDDHYEIPGVGLVLLDQSSPNDRLFLGQASVLHWVSLNDKKINDQLRSIGVLGWWNS